MVCYNIYIYTTANNISILFELGLIEYILESLESLKSLEAQYN